MLEKITDMLFTTTSTTSIQRGVLHIFIVVFCLGVSTGCELVASAYVEKSWVTEPGFTPGKPDLVSRFELKATKPVGRDAKLAKK